MPIDNASLITKDQMNVLINGFIKLADSADMLIIDSVSDISVNIIEHTIKIEYGTTNLDEIM